MGKSKMIILLISFILLSAKAQSQAQFGTKAGLNMAKVNFGDDNDRKILMAVNAGVLSEVNFSKRVFLRPEFLYSMKGWAASGTSNGNDITINLHYLNIPVLFGYRPINKMSFLLGPEIGFLLKAIRKPEAFSVPSPYEKFDYGISIGTTYNVTQHLGMEMRYTYGFNTLVKFTSVDANHQSTGEVSRIGANRVFQMNIFYLFGNDKNEAPKYIKAPIFYIPKDERKVLMSLGFRLGVSNYTMSGGEVDLRQRRGAQLNSMIGSEIGAEAKLDVYKYLYAKIGFSYLEKGGHLDGGGWVYQDPVKVNYFVPSFLVGISPLKTKPITLSAEIGAGYNLLLHSDNAYSNDIVSGYYVVKNNNIGSSLYGFEVSTDAIKNFSLFLNYRYSRDLNFFHARKNDQTGENYDLWNKGYSICLGIRIIK